MCLIRISQYCSRLIGHLVFHCSSHFHLLPYIIMSEYVTIIISIIMMMMMMINNIIISRPLCLPSYLPGNAVLKGIFEQLNRVEVKSLSQYIILFASNTLQEVPMP